MNDPGQRWYYYLCVGAALAIVVLFAIANWIVQPMANQLHEQQQREIQERTDVAWEDVGTQRCYWRKVEPERRICVPQEAR